MAEQHVVEVMAHGDLWAVQEPEADEALSVHEARADAIEAAEVAAGGYHPSTVRIYHKNGTLDEERHVGDRTP